MKGTRCPAFQGDNLVKYVLDYTSASVAHDVVNAVDSIGGTFAGVFDAIATSGSLPFALEILSKLGGGPLAVVLPLKDYFTMHTLLDLPRS